MSKKERIFLADKQCLTIELSEIILKGGWDKWWIDGRMRLDEVDGWMDE